MKKYLVKKGDTLNSVADRFGIKDGATLRSYHNIYCPLEDLLGYDVIVGRELLIPEEEKYLKKEENLSQEQTDEHKETQITTKDSSQKDNTSLKEQNKVSDSSSEHEGKYFVIQKGLCQCDKGFKFPKLKVTSHKKHYWNDANGEADYLAVTEDDLTFDPAAMPFGNCKLKPTPGGYLPCSFAPAGKWKKTYEKVKVMGKSCVTEISELMCTTGGKITIKKHGQQIEISKDQILSADPVEQQIYNPIMNFEDFQEELRGDDLFEVE